MSMDEPYLSHFLLGVRTYLLTGMSHQVTHETTIFTIFPWPPPSRAETPAAVGTRTPTPSRGAPAWLHPVNDGETPRENGLISGVFILNNGIIADLLEV